jgi:hypothetical protein
MLVPIGGMFYKQTVIWMSFLNFGFKQDQYITPVFMTHLHCFPVSRTTYIGIETSVKGIRTDLTTLQTSVNRLNGARGNPQPWADANSGVNVPGWSIVLKRTRKRGIISVPCHLVSNRLYVMPSPEIEVVSALYMLEMA